MADTLYAGKGASATTSSLYTVNPATAVSSAIGASGFALTGLAFEQDGTTLWGASSGNSTAHPRSLISLNASTGAGTFVGAFGTTVSDIACDGSDVLFGWLAIDGSGSLATINKATGAPTIIGDSGISGIGGAIDFNASGTLYLITKIAGVAKLYTINPTTAAPTLVAALSSSTSHTHGAASFSNGDVLYALDGSDGNLRTVNVSTGVYADIATMGSDWDALAWSHTVAGGGGGGALEGVCIAFDDAALTASPTWTRVD